MSHKSINILILKCEDYPEFDGTIQKTYHRYSNGIDFITKYGLVFISDNNYEEVK